MIRTQVYITKEEKESLESLAQSTGKSQSELIRNAIDTFIESNNTKNKKASLLNAFGMWKTNDHDFQQTRESMDR
ncbi:transcriptional regulator, CopG family protein [Lentisphaera araneosa HTCC2155]|jgi:metal-responsive CopG/Arc/MetJ family transcriptional regulator|uniref:Transcriptional regulator, CopG family protein n=1 Tax=Lentisphaera araneosa HTCC2155 TaxID=313628 RepID=A6DU68_9BACT|nr:ribbon-helix-helix domain-containing protein [Lentisphaera araneosa]EDM24827.1 transcriptional regulator, CopG family protein [Lentisphaera araneosa HTCC2155]